jgi:iron complex outermembrane receptor protein
MSCVTGVQTCALPIFTIEVAWEGYVGRHLRLGANAFRYSVTNLISQITDPDGLLMYDNVEASTALGVEAEAEAKWSSGVQARASYAWQEARDTQRDVRLTNSPAHVGQVALSIPLGVRGASANVSLRGLSSRTAKDGSRVDGYFVPAASVVAPLAGERLSLQLTLDNLLDRRYADPAADELRQNVVPQDGRTAYLKLAWRWR